MSAPARMDLGQPDRIDPLFAADVIAGLSSPTKHLPCRWFYDARGSELFERITELPEYYPTRCEIEILNEMAAFGGDIRREGTLLVEFGSGSSRKTEILIGALSGLAAYMPIDVSATALAEAERRLNRRFPALRVLPILGDFADPISFPPDLARNPRLGFFPGSTIGNFQPAGAVRLLQRIGETLGPGSRLLIGVDLRKSRDVLVPAYDDSQGVTAAFNLNLLVRINSELGGDFDLSAFAHEAVWNDEESRIEMHLVSRRWQRARVLGRVFAFGNGERIHTENSYKHTIGAFQDLAGSAGWLALRSWTDRAKLFSVHELERPL